MHENERQRQGAEGSARLRERYCKAAIDRMVAELARAESWEGLALRADLTSSR